MIDRLTFSAIRNGERILAQVAGFDATGAPVRFVADPAVLADNLARQQRYLLHLAGADNHLRALVDAGFGSDQAWAVVESTLPAPLAFDTAVDSAFA